MDQCIGKFDDNHDIEDRSANSSEMINENNNLICNAKNIPEWERIPLIIQNNFHSIACSRMGYSHILKTIECQDSNCISAFSSSTDNYIILAIADGHGSSKHDLSKYGSDIAVKTAISELSYFFNNYYGDNNFFKKDFIRNIPRIITKLWKENVIKDANMRLNQEDYDSFEGDKEKLIIRYGSTLIFCVIHQELLYLGQIGDGNITIMWDNGDIESPFPENDELLGSQTDSLCSKNALETWKTTVINKQNGGIVFLTTDGISDSYANDKPFPENTGFLNLLKIIRNIISGKGILSLREELPKILDDTSKEGSGDDMTLGLVKFDKTELGDMNVYEL